MSAAPMASHSIMTLAPTQSDISQPAEIEDTNVTGLVSLEHYRPFFRELDLDVFKLFAIDKVTFSNY